MNIRNIILVLLLSVTMIGWSQDFPFRLKIDSLEIPGLGGIQSYAFGQANGKWLIIGGRLDGLHRRQPWATFDIAGHNNQLIVIDPIQQKKWTTGLETLPADLVEQLSSTNMQFFQQGDTLILTGGYGFSAQKEDHMTFPFLTVLNVSEVIESVIMGRSIEGLFRQIRDEEFAVTGGQLQLVDSVYFLVGGHRFDGRYNPMNNPTFTQTYTCSIKKFQIDQSNGKIKVKHLPPVRSEEHLHRRDFNVLPQILPNGQQGLIAFSGVFQREVDLPYLNAVVIDKDSFQVVKGFAQYYNHYHCATVSLHDSLSGSMYNLFFGGIAQYHDSSGYLVQDNDVPFVKSVALVKRDQNGWMQEFLLPVQMPGYLGAASEFIINPSLPGYSNDVIAVDRLLGDTVLLGYIFGGINSSAANIFWINEGTESSASRMVYPVYLVRDNYASSLLNEHSTNQFQLQVYPNPSDEELSLAFHLPESGTVTITLENLMGEYAFEKQLKNLPAGEHNQTIRYRKLERGDVYYLKLSINGRTLTQKILVH